VDRVYGPSAGYGGFVTPKNVDASDQALYRRLVQIRWEPRMLLLYGYAGTHKGTSSAKFLVGEVAPWLMR
jgi:hypothetical protein